MADEVRAAWTVTVNTDLTEGKGCPRIKHICWAEATAQRLAKGADVQGSNGSVDKIALMRAGGKGPWLGPVSPEEPTRDDLRMENALAERRDVEARARAAGLSDDDLAVLRRPA